MSTKVSHTYTKNMYTKKELLSYARIILREILNNSMEDNWSLRDAIEDKLESLDYRISKLDD